MKAYNFCTGDDMEDSNTKVSFHIGSIWHLFYWRLRARMLYWIWSTPSVLVLLHLMKAQCSKAQMPRYIYIYIYLTSLRIDFYINPPFSHWSWNSGIISAMSQVSWIVLVVKSVDSGARFKPLGWQQHWRSFSHMKKIALSKLPSMWCQDAWRLIYPILQSFTQSWSSSTHRNRRLIQYTESIDREFTCDRTI